MPLRDQLAANLADVRARIDAAARSAGRDPAEVRLLAVSKTRDAVAVAALADLGQRDFAENRVQELAAKAAELGDRADVRWTVVGQLQRNKAAAVVRLGAAVQSVDRLSLAETLSRAGEQQKRSTDVWIQVDLGGPDGELGSRGGAPPAELWGLADAVADLPALRLRGLMAVAPRGQDPRPAFELLAELAERVRADHPGASELSAGMSSDLEAAVAVGARVVRVGTALFGPRDLTSGADAGE